MCDTRHKSINRTKIDRRIDKHFMQSYWSALHFAPTNLPVLYRGMPQASHGIRKWHLIQNQPQLRNLYRASAHIILQRKISERHFGEIKAIKASLSNTVEQIRPVNGLARLVRLVRPVQVVKQWFTGCTGRGSMVICISLATLHLNLDGTTRTTRTTRTGRETMVHESYNW